MSCLGGALDASTTLLQAGGLTLRQGLAETAAASSATGGSGRGGSGSANGCRQAADKRGGTDAAAGPAPVLLCCATNAGLDVVHVQRCGGSISGSTCRTPGCHCPPCEQYEVLLASWQRSVSASFLP